MGQRWQKCCRKSLLRSLNLSLKQGNVKMLLFFLLAFVSHEIGKNVTIDEGQENYSGMMNDTHRHRGAPQVAVTTRRLVFFGTGSQYSIDLHLLLLL